MRKITLAIFVLAFFATTVFAEEIPKKYYDVKNLVKDFKYIGEELFKDYWQNPTETTVRQGGDCEDFSILINRWLLDNGYESEMVGIYSGQLSNAGHIITVFRDTCFGYSVFSNKWLFEYQASTKLEAIFKYLKDDGMKKEDCILVKFVPTKYGDATYEVWLDSTRQILYSGNKELLKEWKIIELKLEIEWLDLQLEEVKKLLEEAKVKNELQN